MAAPEITVNLYVSLSNGYLKDNFSLGQFQIAQDDPELGGHAQAIGTTEEVLDFGGVTFTEGAVLMLCNLDDTNYVEVGTEESGALCAHPNRLYPGQQAVHMMGPNAVYRAKAHTAPVNLFVRFYPFTVATGS